MLVLVGSGMNTSPTGLAPRASTSHIMLVLVDVGMCEYVTHSVAMCEHVTCDVDTDLYPPDRWST